VQLSFKKDKFLYFTIAILIFLGGLFLISEKIKTKEPSYSFQPVFYNFSAYQKGDLFLDQDQLKIEAPQMVVYQKNTIASITCSQTITPQILASLVGVDEAESIGSGESGEIKEYIVQQGDTISSIAGKFNISVNTILWTNNLSSRSLIRPGQKLVILPVSGVLHIVKKGDTLSGISKLYGVSQEKIVDINGLSSDGRIYIGDFLVIPGGKPLAKNKDSLYSFQVPIGSNYFMCPILSPCRITQGLHWYNAVDFSHGVCGEPILAAAGGIVQKVGYHNIAGKYIRVLHPNGVVTFYGHLSEIIVSSGQKVSQGQIIGYMGHTGYTIPAGPRGCHLHFEVIGAKNPFASY